jgi:hypothetical protein
MLVKVFSDETELLRRMQYGDLTEVYLILKLVQDVLTARKILVRSVEHAPLEYID